MPDLPTRPKTATRRLLREADHPARGRQLTQRKADEYRRSRDRRAARGEAELWVWVPESHAPLIRALVAAFCATAHAGEMPLLSWAQDPEPPSRAPTTPPSRLPSDAGDDEAPAAEAPWDEAYDPALWRGQGEAARRRAQAQRARARKQAAGLKRLRLVVPRALKPKVAALVAEIRAGLEDGLLPVLKVPPTEAAPDPGGAPARMAAPAAEWSPASRPGAPSETASPFSSGQVFGKDLAMSDPAAAHPNPLRPPPDTAKLPETGKPAQPDDPCADEMLTGTGKETSTLFEDIQALDRLPAFLHEAQPEKQNNR